MGDLINEIDGVLITELKRILTPGGDVFRAMKTCDPGYTGFGEAYFSTINPNSVKPWKRHNRMTLNLIVISGSVRFILHDDRAESLPDGITKIVELGPDLNYARLTVPPGIWMAFKCLGEKPGLLLNLADIMHDPTETDRKALNEIEFDWSQK